MAFSPIKPLWGRLKAGEFKARVWKRLVLYSTILWALGAAGCGLFPGLVPQALTATPSPSEMPPLAASPTPSATLTPTVRPWPTLPSAPAVVEVLDLAAPSVQGVGPTALGLVGGELYVANEESQNLLIFRERQAYQSLPLAPGPYRIVSDPANGRVYILCLEGRSVFVIEGDHLAAQWSLDGRPSSGVLVGGNLWMGTWEGGLWRMDAAGAEGPTLVASGLGMIVDLFALDERWLLIITHQEAMLYDMAAHQKGLSRALEGYQTAFLAQGILYLVRYDATAGATWLETWNAPRLEPMRQVPAPDAASALWVDPTSGQAIVAAAEKDRLYAVNLETGALLQECVAGLRPQQMLYDGAGSLYVPYKGSHLVAVVSVNGLAVVERIPTALQVTALATGWEGGDLLVGLNTGEIRALRPDASFQSWRVAVYPVAIANIPLLNRIAVLDGALGALLMLDYQGNIVKQYPTGPNPQGLYVDALHQALYAGDIRLDWSSGAVEILRIPVNGGEVYPPIGVLRDTKRDRLCAVVWNGIPGSNGGYRVVCQERGNWRPDLPAPGHVSVLDVLYDERTDCFYSTYARMGQYGLQVFNAETLTEQRHLPLERYPQAIALSELGHLWLVLSPVPGRQPPVTRLLALDTQTWGLAAALEIPDHVDRAVWNPLNQRLYLACGASGRIYIVQDVAVPAPLPTLTPFVTLAPSLVPATPSPTLTRAVATPAPSATPQPSPTPTCAQVVDEALRDAWQSGRPGGFGCPTGAPRRDHWGWQDFERGEMFWMRETRQILVLFDDGTWTYFSDQWQEGMPELSCEASPPPGLWQPIRGFGLVWCREPGLRDRLGWALGSEIAFESLSQPFGEGSLVLHPQGGAIWITRRGTWVRIFPSAP